MTSEQAAMISGPTKAVRAPTMSLEKMSRPSWSVPSQCSALGPDIPSEVIWALGSWGATR